MSKDIAVTLTSDTRKFSSGMKSARDDLSLLSTGIKAAGVAVAGFLTFQAVKSGLGALTDTIGKLDDLAAESERLGVSTEFLSELHHAAKLSDTDIEALNGGLEKLEKNLGKATDDGKGLTDTLAKFGLDAQQLAAAGPEEAFLRISDAAAGIRDPFQRAAFVTDLFGKSGQSLLGILGKGREGITELRKEARLLGVSLSSDAAEKAGLADDAMKRLDSSWMGLKTTLAIELAPAMTSFVNWLAIDVPAGARKAKAEVDSLTNSFGDLINLIASGPTNLFGSRKMDKLRSMMLPDKNGTARPLKGDMDVVLGEPGEFPNRGKGADGPAAAVGDILKEFKSFAKPLAIDSKEGFSTIARALTKSTTDPVGNKQLAEQKIANKHLAKIEDGLKNQPKIAPPF